MSYIRQRGGARKFYKDTRDGVPVFFTSPAQASWIPAEHVAMVLRHLTDLTGYELVAVDDRYEKVAESE